MNTKLSLPEPVMEVLSRLNRHGYEAFAVGGCVRDQLLGKVPGDWDVTTSATPQEMKEVFGDLPHFDTGIRHGTLTLLVDRMPIEVTTYRVEGTYSDRRHPDQVTFTRLLARDLARRDFTVNALAFHPQTGVVDLYGGIGDLTRGILRCVGEPDRRFQEDALRILRALRFSAQLGFALEEGTRQGVLRNRGLLTQVAWERIACEFQKLLCGPWAVTVLREYLPVIGVFLPELLPLAGFEQHNPHHIYDIWEHTLHALELTDPQDRILRWAVLLHDVGKPACFSLDERGIGHFYGHPQAGEKLARAMLHRLKLDNDTIQQVCTLIHMHDVALPENPATIRRWVGKYTLPTIRQFLAIRRADHGAQAFSREKEEAIRRWEALLEQTLAENSCCTFQQLAVSGRDLLALGIPQGPEMGAILQELLDQVVQGQLPNTPQALLDKAERLKNHL